MDEEILDYKEQPPQRANHANRCFKYFMIALFISLITAIESYLLQASSVKSPTSIKSGSLEQLVVLSGLFCVTTIIAVIFSYKGFLSGIQSFKADENSPKKKYVGTIGNFVIMLFILWLMIAT